MDPNPPKNSFKSSGGLIRIYRAFFYSLSGFKHAFVHESAFRQELLLTSLLLPIALWVEVSRLERVALIASVFLVLIVELVNSAIEAAIDRISLDEHPLSGRAKDLGSAAVMLALLVCVLTWCSILLK